MVYQSYLYSIFMSAFAIFCLFNNNATLDMMLSHFSFVHISSQENTHKNLLQKVSISWLGCPEEFLLLTELSDTCSGKCPGWKES
jgi:hypothetical protein